VPVTFDPPKRLWTLSERGIDLAVDAEKVFAGDTWTVAADRFDYGEVRWLTIGWLNDRMAFVVWTERGADRHVISMRYCHAKEQARFLKRFDPG
jgi:uncharacterized DUF497 family protein